MSQSKPVSPGGLQRIFLGAELPDAQARGPWKLRLREADGTRTVEFGNITFPE